MTTYKNPWADAANQAVGALYKHYLTKPSPADMEAARLKAQMGQADLTKTQLSNEMTRRRLNMGDFAMEGISAPIQNQLYRNSLGGDRSAVQVFDSYVRPNMQVDAGDAKYITSGVTGLPIQEYGVGVAPSNVVDKEGGRIITTPSIASTNRPVMGENGRVLVANAAQAAGVDPRLADGVFGAESSYGMNQGPSPAGAVGPMQVMPSTASDPGFGVEPARDDSQQENVRVAVDYLSAMMNRYNGDEEAALIAYNAGPANADKWINSGRDYNVLPNPQETQPYVQRVLNSGRSPEMPQQTVPTETTITQIPDTHQGSDGLRVTPLPRTEKATSARARVTNLLTDVANMYRQLDGMNAIVDTEGTPGENLTASIRSSPFGQFFGRTFGTEAQSIRNKINQIRPTLMNEIRQATEMGARGLDSEKELDFYLQAVSDPTRDVQSNLAALEVLNEAYGLGASNLSTPESIEMLQEEFQASTGQEAETQTIGGYSMEDIEFTAQEEGKSVEEVIKIIRSRTRGGM